MFLKSRVALIVLLISILLAGCARPIPDLGISSEYLNRYLEIKPVPDFNKFRFAESIVLSITARTDVEVKVNFGNTRIFVFDEKLNDWREIKDNGFSGTGIFSGADLLPESSSKPPDVILSKSCVSNHCKQTETFGVDPDVQNNGKSVDVLVVVSGHIYKNGIMTDQKTGAYVIFTLRP
jgi:hypothetical protein